MDMTTTFSFSQLLMSIFPTHFLHTTLTTMCIALRDILILPGYLGTSFLWEETQNLIKNANSKFQEEIYVLVAHDSPYSELLRFDKLSLWRMCQLLRSLLPACVYSFHTILYHVPQMSGSFNHPIVSPINSVSQT